MSAVGVAVPTGASVVDRRTLPAGLSRLVAFAAFALLAALRWGVLLAPSSRGRLVVCAIVALVVAIAAHHAGGLPGRARIGAWVAIAVAALLAVLLASGVPLTLLRPGHWGDLASSLGQGIEGLPTIGVPYRGVDPWIRIVLLAGGGLLLVLAGFLTARALRGHTRPVGAAAVLAVAYVIPVVERSPAHPFAWGVLFTVLAGALLWADRIEHGYAAAAGVFVVLAVGGALIASARLDAAEPWVDYQAIVESLSTPPSIGFDWDHGYGPLRWPRENRVMLRVASERPHYWKAVDLETFDGIGWTTVGTLPPTQSTEHAPNHADWTVDLRVTVRDLRSPLYVTAGTGIKVEHTPRFAVRAGPGSFATGREPLRRGDSYTAQVYAPDPTVRELRAAGTGYPPLVDPYLTMELPADVGGPPVSEDAPSTLAPPQIEFPQFSVLSARTPPVAIDSHGLAYANASPLLQRSQYAEMFALARRIRAGADTPYDVVRAVQSRLATGYAYTEKPAQPRPGRPPLVSFLFDTHAGYCQHFSGAMALLLRMSGVPARVSSGFSPGTFDDGRDEWVVRDVDAHSWVEVYFPQLGWVTFDPTPGVAPPRTQLVNGPAPADAAEIPLRPGGPLGEVPARASGGDGAAPAEDGGSPWAIVGVVVLVAGAGLAVLVAVRRRGQPDDGPGDLAELRRALRLTGREIEPNLTLQALEQRFGRHAPGAAAYVAALRLARYGGRSERPTLQQRAALRAELAAGLGTTGRMRAWLALPPARSRP